MDICVGNLLHMKFENDNLWLCLMCLEMQFITAAFARLTLPVSAVIDNWHSSILGTIVSWKKLWADSCLPHRAYSQ